MFGRHTSPIRQEIPLFLTSDDDIPPTLVKEDEIPPSLVKADEIPPPSLVREDEIPPTLLNETDRQPILPHYVEEVELVHLIADAVREIMVRYMRRDDGREHSLAEILGIEAQVEISPLHLLPALRFGIGFRDQITLCVVLGRVAAFEVDFKIITHHIESGRRNFDEVLCLRS